MNWDAIGAVGEILGAVAVFASLLYLGAQIRTQNKESRLASIREYSKSLNHINGRIAADSKLASIWHQGITQGLETLSDDDAVQFSAYLIEVFRIWEGAYFQFHDEDLDERLWNSVKTQMSDLVSTKTFRQWWPIRSRYFSEDFRNYIDNLEAGIYTSVSEREDDDT